MDTQKLIEILTKEVLKEINKLENRHSSEINENDIKFKFNGNNEEKEKTLVTFLGNDEVLKDELKKSINIFDKVNLNSSWEELIKNNKEFENTQLIVSEFSINNLLELSQGKKSIITEYLFNEGDVILVEEGLEYKKYKEPLALIQLYDEYVEKIKKYGIKVVKRIEIKENLFVKKKTFIKGLITENKLKSLGIKNQIVIVEGKTKITALAMDYIRENNIEIYYERGY